LKQREDDYRLSEGEQQISRQTENNAQGTAFMGYAFFMTSEETVGLLNA